MSWENLIENNVYYFSLLPPQGSSSTVIPKHTTILLHKI